MPENQIQQAVQNSGAVPFLAAMLGGLLDYVGQLRRGVKVWSVFGFVLHVVSAMFFGWVFGELAMIFFPTDSPGAFNAWVGLGGFLGTRVIDIALSFTKK